LAINVTVNYYILTIDKIKKIIKNITRCLKSEIGTIVIIIVKILYPYEQLFVYH